MRVEDEVFLVQVLAQDGRPVVEPEGEIRVLTDESRNRYCNRNQMEVMMRLARRLGYDVRVLRWRYDGVLV